MFENAKLTVEFREFFAIWQSNNIDRCFSRTDPKGPRDLKVEGGNMTNFQQNRFSTDGLLTRCKEDNDAGSNEAESFEESSVPRRYREGRDRINIERVRRDQRRARSEFIRALVRSLKR